MQALIWYYNLASSTTPAAAPVEEPQQPVAHAAPSNLAATEEARLVTMNWQPNAPGANQLVEAAENGGAYTSLGVWDDATNMRQFVVSEAATVVNMRVKALGNGTTTLDSEYATTSLNIVQPVPVTGPSNATSTASGNIVTASWTPGAADRRQQVEASEDAGATFRVIATLGALENTVDFVTDYATAVVIRIKSLAANSSELDSAYASTSITTPSAPPPPVPLNQTSGVYIRGGTFAGTVMTGNYQVKTHGTEQYIREALLAINKGAGTGAAILEFTITNIADIIDEVFEILLAPAFDAETVTWNTFDRSACTLLTSVTHKVSNGAVVKVQLTGVASAEMLYLAVRSRNNAGTSQVEIATFESATPPKLTFGTLDPYAGMTKALLNGVVANGATTDTPTNDLSAWQALVTKAKAETGGKIYFPAPYMSCLHSTWNQSLDDIQIVGGGTFCVNKPRSHNPAYTSSETNYTLINWSGARGHFGFGVDARFDNRTHDRWWRGRDAGATASKLMVLSGDFATGEIKVMNAGGLGLQSTGKNCTVSIEGIDNAYCDAEWRGNAGAGNLQRIHIPKYTSIKTHNYLAGGGVNISDKPRMSDKALILSTQSDNTAYIDYVQIDDYLSDNASVLCEGGLGVGSSDSTGYIRNVVVGRAKIIARRLQNYLGGSSTDGQISTNGKWENVERADFTEVLETVNYVPNGQSVWFDACKHLYIKKLITDSWCFRCAVVQTTADEVIFRLKSATQKLAYAPVYVTNKAGQRVNFGPFTWDGNNIARTYSTSETLFDLSGKGAETVVVIQSLQRINCTEAPYLMKGNTAKTATIQILSGGLNGFRKGTNARVIDANGNPL